MQLRTAKDLQLKRTLPTAKILQLVKQVLYQCEVRGYEETV
jgi:hypothetical protein